MKKTGGQIWREGQDKVKPSFPKIVEKEWGREIWMANNLSESMRLFILPKARCR